MIAQPMAAKPAAPAHRHALHAYGAGLLLIGALSLILGGFPHWTVLIPAILGGAVLGLALAARGGGVSDAVAGAGALLVCALALAGTLTAVPLLPDALAGAPHVARPGAVTARAATALASAAFAPAFILLWWRAVREGRRRAGA
jgi:hypothetical protein